GIQARFMWHQRPRAHEIHASASGYYKLGSIVAVIGNFYTTHHHHVHAPDLGRIL
uniref:Uncharacterized protein n=1 Tax=Aegilops tauschii subsp. strangulata TaxID=200361 RepID=A0A453RYH7_AEGTS